MKDSIIHTKVISFAFGGDGVAVLPDGKKCFVPGGIPGDELEIRIVQDKSRFARGVIRKIIIPSPVRKDSFCPLRTQNPVCPSCVYAEVDYDEEIRWKQKQFEFFMQKFRTDETTVLPPFPSPQRTGYRNKLTLSCEKGKAGYRASDNRTLIPVSRCLLAKDEINDLPGKFTAEKEDTRLTFRWTKHDGAKLYRTGQSKKDRCEYLTETLGGYGDFQVPDTSFFQVNTAVAEELIRRVLAVMEETKPEFLLELFSGSGIFSLIAAQRFPDLQTHGVELDKEAVKTAIRNAGVRYLRDRCTFQCGDAAEYLLPESFVPGKMLLLTDPPRTGMAKELIRKILTDAPAYVLYISCAPDMLKRDLELLSAGYRVRQTGLLDMFPATAHFESMTLLERS